MLKGKTIFCDTNFLINATQYNSKEFKLKEKFLKESYGLAYNSTVHSELIHVVRFELIEHYITENEKKLSLRH